MLKSHLILPYAKNDPDREAHYSDDMEVATLLCIAEAERKKKPGIFGGEAESLVFLSKIHYPIWAIPWRNHECWLVDGMETVTGDILYFRPPNVESFIEQLKRSSTVQELYHSTLKSHRETFSEFISQTEMHIDGFITDKDLLADMSMFVQESKVKTNSAFPEFKSLMHHRINEETATQIGNRIVGYFKKLQAETKGLQFAVSTLNEETKKHVEKLQLEMEQAQEKYNDRILDEKTEFENKREKLERERDKKMERILSAHEKEVDVRLAERKKWERELLMLEQKESEYEKRKELRKQKEDKIGESRWNAKIRDVQNQIATAKKRIKSLLDFVKRSSKEIEKTTRKLNDTYQKLIDEERKKITDLENSRDSTIQKIEKTISELQRETLAIVDDIKRLIDHKRECLTTLEEAAFSWKIEDPILVHIPFYLIQYKTDKEKRYCFSSPMFARSHKGLVMRIRKTFKHCSSLLKPRSKALEKILASFIERLDNDKMMRRELDNLGNSQSLLATAGFKEKLRKGIKKLEAEGWIKAEEKKTLMEIYTKD
ncbi:MAG: hypothetical protein JSV05_08445 [Candidatus Bathyarchaeota archaeon]|nr:MAG: hypothetical protein JSV05_08445 [Candidatus Bathyarchaeota archaeon]